MKADIVDVYEFDLVYSAEHFFVFSWGIDMGFFKKFSPKQNHNANKYIMSSGKTWRDYDQLISAARRLNIPMKIYCRQECYPTLPIPGHVQILSGFFPFEQICKDYADASIVLIPLASNPRGAFGFTSLLEAMAMGKPIIMSRNENVDIDIDNEKIGTSVEQEGWVTAISTMFYDESLLKEMGENSRKLGNEKFHIDLFAEKLAFVLKDTYRRHTEKV
jgi:glycosyltransferase involved in cell wall biosynthesis